MAVNWTELAKCLTTGVCFIADVLSDPIATGTTNLMLLLGNNF
jgi:hypothetical protein